MCSAAAPPPCDGGEPARAHAWGSERSGDLSASARGGLGFFFFFLWGIFRGEMKRREEGCFHSLVSGMDRWERVELRQAVSG